MDNKPIHQEVILDLQYLPNTNYFICLLYFDTIHIDIHEYYEKQSYRNRCEILTTHGKMGLSIPIIKPPGKQIMKNIEIDHSQKWMRHHWRSICAAYGKAPFFEYYADYFKPFFESPMTHLAQFNLELLTLCLKLIGISKQISVSNNYIEKPQGNTDLLDLRAKIHPKKALKEKRLFDTLTYQQVFGKSFVADLSILDIIFCEGPNTKQLLKKTITQNKNDLKSSFLG